MHNSSNSKTSKPYSAPLPDSKPDLGEEDRQQLQALLQQPGWAILWREAHNSLRTPMEISLQVQDNLVELYRAQGALAMYNRITALINDLGGKST